MLLLVCLVALLAQVAAVPPVQGTRCAPNQVINRLTVFEDGALEAECGPIPCGQSGTRCIEDQTSCRADTDVFSGMRWAANGQSALLRCCTLKTTNKIYVGTDLVASGSYYQGGAVAKKELYGSGGAEYDFIANIRTEQGGVRVWVYRIMCEIGETTTRAAVQVQPTMRPTTERVPEKAHEVEEEEEVEESEEQGDDNETEDVEEEEETPVEKPEIEAQPFNPLRYRPTAHRASTGVKRA